MELVDGSIDKVGDSVRFTVYGGDMVEEGVVM
jgi:hypothetical protein